MASPRNKSPEAIMWRSERSRLSRAVNSGDPAKVLEACEHYREKFVPHYGMSDFWSNWARAAEDAALRIRQNRAHEALSGDVLDRLYAFLEWIR